MTKFQNSKVAKLAAGLVSGAFLLGAVVVAPAPAHAQTSAELEAQIQSLLATIAALQAQLGSSTGGSSSAGVCPVGGWTRDLSTGSTGADVKALQVFLNGSADTRVAVSGAGSPGMETMYYGPATAAAVSRFQVKYAAQILTPVGLTAGTGYFGAGSRAQANKLCAGQTPSDNGNGNGGVSNNGNEADLTDYSELRDVEKTVHEGDSEQKIFGARFDVEDGDISIQRVDVNFEATGSSGSKQPWRYFDSVSLMLGDDEIASMDTDSRNDWEEEDNDVYQLRFTNLDETVNEGDRAELYVVADISSRVDDTDQQFTVSFPVNGIRAIDSAGLNQYVPDSAGDVEDNEVSFDTEVTGDLDINESDDNPDQSILVADEDDESDEYTVLVFDVEANDADALITDLDLTLTSGSSSIEDLVSDVSIEADGETYTYDDWEHATSSTATVHFTDLDINVDEDDTVSVAVRVTLNPQDGNYAAAGETITASIDHTDVTAENDETGAEIEGSDISGSANGETHSVVVNGVAVEAVSTDASVSDADNQVGTFTIKFDVTAVGDDAYIPTGADASGTSVGATWDLVGSGATTTATTSGTLTSTAKQSGGYFRVSEGNTETFTMKVFVDAATSGAYGAELDTVNFKPGNTSASTETVTVPNTSDFETAQEYIGA